MVLQKSYVEQWQEMKDSGSAKPTYSIHVWGEFQVEEESEDAKIRQTKYQ